MSDSEERTLRPSSRKLRKAREKGQIPLQRDMRILVVTSGGLLYLWLALGDIADHFRTSAALSFALLQDPNGAYDEVIAQSVGAATRIVGTLFVVLAGLLVIVSIVLNRGVVLSLDPILPKLSHLDPVKGIKRIFSARTLAEIAKSLARLALATIGIALVARSWGAAVLHAPRCGASCLLELTVILVVLVVGAVLAAAAAVSVLDLPLQAWLFERDQKMTKTEAKTEAKDMHGSPEIRGALRRLRREAANARGGRLGVSRATLVIAGPREAVAIRYVREEHGIPVIVAKVRGPERMAALIDQVTSLSVPMVDDPSLAHRIMQGARAGSPIRPAEYTDTARLIQATH